MRQRCCASTIGVSDAFVEDTRLLRSQVQAGSTFGDVFGLYNNLEGRVCDCSVRNRALDCQRLEFRLKRGRRERVMRDRGSGKRAREMSRIVVVCWRGRVVSLCLFLRMICGSCWLHISSKLQIGDLEDRKASHRQGPASCSSTRQLLSSPARPVTRLAVGEWWNDKSTGSALKAWISTFRDLFVIVSCGTEVSFARCIIPGYTMASGAITREPGMTRSEMLV